MKVNKLQLLGLLIGTFLLVGASAGSAVTVNQGNSGNMTVQTDEITVTIRGGSNVPMYTFWETDDNSTKYMVQFSQIFEAEDNETSGTDGAFDQNDRRVSGSSVSLSPLTWTFSEQQTDGDGSIHFDMTSTSPAGTSTVFTFRNHVYADVDNSIKFDVLIDNYEFKSDTSMLVFGFKLISAGEDGENNPDTSLNGNQVNFGDAFFESEETATANGNDVSVGLSSNSDDEEGSFLYLSYSNFEGNLVHDPTVGVQASALNSDDNNDDGAALADASDKVLISWDEGISKEDASLSTFFASFIAVVIPVAIYRRK